MGLPLHRLTSLSRRNDHTIAGLWRGYSTIVQWSTLVTFGLVFAYPFGLTAFLGLFFLLIPSLMFPPLGLVILIFIGQLLGYAVMTVITVWIASLTVGGAIWLAVRVTLERAGSGPTLSTVLAAPAAQLTGCFAARELLRYISQESENASWFLADPWVWKAAQVLVLTISPLVAYAVFYEK